MGVPHTCQTAAVLARRGVHVKLGAELVKLNDIASVIADDVKSITVIMKGGRKIVHSKDGFDAVRVRKAINDKKTELGI